MAHSTQKIPFPIIRETREQSLLTELTNANAEKHLSASVELSKIDVSVLGKPITALLPLENIKSVLVLWSRVNRSNREISDAEIIKLLSHSKLMTYEDLMPYHLAPGQRLVITTNKNENVMITLMIGFSPGRVEMPDGQVYWFKVFA